MLQRSVAGILRKEVLIPSLDEPNTLELGNQFFTVLPYPDLTILPLVLQLAIHTLHSSLTSFFLFPLLPPWVFVWLCPVPGIALPPLFLLNCDSALRASLTVSTVISNFLETSSFPIAKQN